MAGGIVLITGSSTGIGHEAGRQLAAQGWTVYLSARDRTRAHQAAQEIAEAGDVRVLDVDLDVDRDESVQAAAELLAREPARLDVLVNNAAAYVDWQETATGADLEQAAAIMQTNLLGAWRATQALLGLLRASAHPRVVNVASGAGSHDDEQFGLTKRHGAAASYGISKAALGALTSTLAAELAETPILVNAVCPGLTATWPGAEQMGARPIAEGAASVVWAVTLPDDGPRGGFFRDGKPLPW